MMDIIRHLILCAVILFILPINGLAEPFTFTALGDTQDNSDKGLVRLDNLIGDINQREPSFVVHIGELKGGRDSCHDEYYQRLLTTVNKFDSPLIYLLGDNDWTDCFHSNFDPLERLSYLRNLLYQKPVSLGKTVMPVTRQSNQPAFKDFPENVWWEKEGVLFATFHNVGTNNNLYTNPQAIQEHLSRNAANLAWLDNVFKKASTAKALVLLTHANIQFDARPWEPTGFDVFRSALSGHVRQYGRPVLFIHGDTHQHKIDKPLKYKHQAVTNFTRLEVFGSPDLGAVYIHVYPDTENVFRFEPVAVNLSD